MKPRLLEIQGLHSFREAQEVDFSLLAGGGLFGIFGPTGSGKSTILDALLLALYGRVYRAASSHNRGILNQHEGRLRVALTFETGSGDGQGIYRVERVYGADRNEEFGIRTRACRLLDLTGGQERVVEDQTRRLDARVQEIIGLSYEDFTRAVVLPQGQFAQFLLLENASRRDMLERVFALGDYGRHLRDTVGDHRARTEDRLNQTRLALAGLGDASPETRAAAAEAAWAAEAACRAAEAGKTALEGELAEKKTVWDLQEGLGFVREALAKLTADQGEILEVEGRLAAAIRAEGLRSPMEGLVLAELAAENSWAKLSATEAAEDQARLALAGAEELYLAAAGLKESREPELARREEQLKRAGELERQLAHLSQERAALGEQIETLAGAIVDLEAGLAQKEAAGKADEETLGQLKEQMSQVQVTAAERERLIRSEGAWRALREAEAALALAKETEGAKGEALGTVEKAWQAASGVWGEALAALKSAGAELEKWSGERPGSEAEEAAGREGLERFRGQVRELGRLTGETEGVLGEIDVLEKALGAIIEEEGLAKGAGEEAEIRHGTAKSALAAEEEALRRLKVRHLAVSLAVDLAEGESCPVCGAASHPHPAAADAATEEALSNAQERAEAVRRELVAAAEAERTANAAWSGSAARLQAAGASLEGKREELGRRREAEERLRADWAPARRGLSLAETASLLAQVEKDLASFSSALGVWNEGLRRCQEAAGAAEKAAGVAEVAEGKAKAAWEAAQKALGEAQGTTVKAGKAAQEKRTLWDAVRGDLDGESLPVRFADLRSRDEAAKELEAQLGELAERIELRRQEIRTGMVVLEDTKRDLAIRQERLNGMDADIRGKTDLCDQLTGGGSAGAALDELRRTLAEIREAYVAAKQAHDEAKKAQEAAGRELAAASGQQKADAGHLEKAAKGLAEALVKGGFATREEALAALIEPRLQEEMEEGVARHKEEGTRLTNEEVRLTGLLHGRMVTPEELTECRERTQAAVEEYKAVAVAEGIAKKTLGDLQNKAEAWAGLTEELSSLDLHLGRLLQLAKWLEGNALVEYLAAEQLEALAGSASQRLARLTHGRLALEVGDKGEFLIRDVLTGKLRPVRQLSGGETFLVSLALSIALSSQIQLRGTSRLGFFFLDEGFGSLDPATLETALDALERLHLEDMTIGVISHVPEVRQRIQRRLIVEPAEAWGAGTRLRVEYA